jgi:DNA-directed RNA polymerase
MPHLSYMKLRNARLKPLNYSSKTFKVPIEGSYDKHKQIRAIMPNLVHSLDAACLSMLINNYFNSYNIKIKNIYGVHDCFGVTANNVDFIINDLKTIYINIYSDNGYLVKFNNEIIHNIKLHYGEESFDDENLVIKFDRTTINYPDMALHIARK